MRRISFFLAIAFVVIVTHSSGSDDSSSGRVRHGKGRNKDTDRNSRKGKETSESRSERSRHSDRSSTSRESRISTRHNTKSKTKNTAGPLGLSSLTSLGSSSAGLPEAFTEGYKTYRKMQGKEYDPKKLEGSLKKTVSAGIAIVSDISKGKDFDKAFEERTPSGIKKFADEVVYNPKGDTVKAAIAGTKTALSMQMGPGLASMVTDRLEQIVDTQSSAIRQAKKGGFGRQKLKESGSERSRSRDSRRS